ncbi:MAG TPA: hypothetical protein VFJ24_01670 [Gaiellales bacterium]|nr:hypothetical protein [Gaiellales bacterium]
MSENGGSDHDRLTRLLREQGPAKAPPGMAGDVMRRVRAEPRPSAPSRWRPVGVLVAAAVVAIAAVLGISRLGNGSSSSASLSAAPSAEKSSSPGSAGANGGVSSAPGTLHAGKTVFRGIRADALTNAFALPGLPSCGSLDTYTLHVRASAVDATRRQLLRFAPETNGVTVHLRGDAHARPHVSCP